MPAAVRLMDQSQGHSCYPPRPNTQASNTVFINGKGAHRKGDKWMIHMCNNQSHDGVLSQGSPTVFVDGKQQGRVGDSISCGDTAKTGSPDVYVG